MKTIEIDFNNLDEKLVVFEAIEIERVLPKKIYENFEFNCCKIELKVEGSNYLENPEKLFKLSVEDNYNKEPIIENPIKNTKLLGKNRCSIFIDIVLYPAEIKIIKDYPDIDKSKLLEDISLNLIFQPSKNINDVIQKKFELVLALIKEKARPYLTITKNDDFKKPFQFKKDTHNFGRLEINNRTNYHFGERLEISDLKFTLFSEDGTDEIENALYVDNRNGLGSINVLPKKTSAPINLLINLDNKKLIPTSQHTYTVKINGGKIIEPNAPKHYINEEDYEQCKFEIKRDKESIELLMDYMNPKHRKAEWSDLFNLDRDYKPIELENKITYNTRSPQQNNILELRIGNRSTNSRLEGEIEISDIDFILRATTGSEFLKVDKDLKDAIKLEIINKFKGEKIESYGTRTFRFKPDTNSFLHFRLLVIESELKNILIDDTKENLVQVHFLLKFKYKKEIDGVHLSQNDRQFNFVFKIAQHAGNEWIVLDYGTSAIVSCYGSFDKVITLNLQQHLKETLGKDNYESDSYEESHTEFLSSYSQIVRKNVENPIISSYTKNPIRVSPTAESMTSDVKLVLPYIKALIGHRNLPKYAIRKIREKNPDIDIAKFSTKNIIISVYRVLLNDFVKSILDKEEEQQKNKLVLTIPNLFSQRHQLILKDIVKEVFKTHIWHNKIKFVAESDAVAFYYFRDLAPEKGNKTIMVYDLGAGTLDITIFKIIRDKRGDTLKILAKSGSTCAGNYVDSILAETFYIECLKPKLENPEKIDEINNWSPVKNHLDEKQIFSYKKFIKQELKPKLSEEKNFKFDDINEFSLNKESVIVNKEKEYDLSKVINSKEFTKYLDKVTKEQLEMLKRSFNFDGDKIHTVIMTGRGSRLFSLKDKLEIELKRIFNDGIELQHLEGNDAKSCVAEGALYFINNEDLKRINFEPLPSSNRYGLLKSYDGGIYSYQELINPRSEKSDSKGHFETKEEGILFNEVIDIDNVRSMSIIQTFEGDPEKIIQMKKDDELFEISSEIVKLTNCEHGLDPRINSCLTFFVTLSGELFYKFAGIERDRNIPLETQFVNFDSDSFKRSMWPFL